MRKSARLDKQPTTDEAAPLPESEYSFTLARVAVAQICQSMGFKGAQNSALEALTDIATRYLRAMAKLGAASANSNGRTQSNLPDIIMALEDLASVQGFLGSSTIRSRSLYTSAVIKDLMKFVKYADEVPFARPLPPSRNFSRGKFLKSCENSKLQYDERGLRHVPRWLPAVPVVEEKEKEREVEWWGCLEEEQDESCSERKMVEGETPNSEIDTSGKRGKVRFKMGIGNPTMVGSLRGVGIRKRVWCE